MIVFDVKQHNIQKICTVHIVHVIIGNNDDKYTNRNKKILHESYRDKRQTNSNSKF